MLSKEGSNVIKRISFKAYSTGKTEYSAAYATLTKKNAENIDPHLCY